MIRKLPNFPTDHPPGVAVFCGAHDGSGAEFRRDAAVLGTGLAERNLRLVYGGGSIGLMGAVADAVHAANGNSLGIVPSGIFEDGIPRRAQHIITAPNLRERKALMRENAEIFVALPGGLGTLDELVETAVERQLQRHEKPIILIDTAGYWDPFFDMLIKMTDTGFLTPALQPVLILAKDAADALAHIDRHHPALPESSGDDATPDD